MVSSRVQRVWFPSLFVCVSDKCVRCKRGEEAQCWREKKGIGKKPRVTITSLIQLTTTTKQERQIGDEKREDLVVDVALKPTQLTPTASDLLTARSKRPFLFPRTQSRQIHCFEVVLCRGRERVSYHPFLSYNVLCPCPCPCNVLCLSPCVYVMPVVVIWIFSFL